MLKLYFFIVITSSFRKGRRINFSFMTLKLYTESFLLLLKIKLILKLSYFFSCCLVFFAFYFFLKRNVPSSIKVRLEKYPSTWIIIKPHAREGKRKKSSPQSDYNMSSNDETDSSCHICPQLSKFDDLHKPHNKKKIYTYVKLGLNFWYHPNIYSFSISKCHASIYPWHCQSGT